MSTVEISNLSKAALSMDWLAKIFWKAPDEETIRAFPLTFFEEFEANEEGIYIVLKATEDTSLAALNELSIDHTALFAGYRSDSPHPYESVYRSQGRLLMGAPRDAVLGFYRNAGFSVEHDSDREPEDHITYELRLLSFLYQNAAAMQSVGNGAAVEGLLENVRAFKRNHLAQWVPSFCADIAAQSKTDFYRGAALLLQAVPVHSTVDCA